MTTVIDERVVEMRFNNADFEKNVAQSMKTLDKLKDSLNFDSAKGLENLGKATKNFNLEGISRSISEATTKFSVLEVAGITAISNITNKIVNMGVNLAKSLTINQVTAGFQKFSEKTTSVQTIMAATAKDFADTNVQMKYVSDQLEKLNWFTDETSYNFLDMVNNIGKFTSNGIKLDDSVTAMIGIANWAAISGANINEASRAMYNLSQALGAGGMKVVDWKSIENANMATAQFKELVAETAVQEGMLKKTADGVYETLAGHEFTIAQFREQLKDDWFTSDVIIKSLSKYGQFTEDLYAAVKKYDSELSATNLLDLIEDYKEGTLDVSEIVEKMGINGDDLKQTIAELADPVNELGYNALRAGQEVRTFSDIIGAVRDTVSSSWSAVFEKLIGNLEQAKTFWGGVYDIFDDLFIQGIKNFSGAVSQMKTRKEMIESFVNVLNLALGPFKAFRSAWRSLFPDTKYQGTYAEMLDRIVIKIRDFTKAIQPSAKALAYFKITMEGVLKFGRAIIKVFFDVVKAIFPITKPIGSLIELFLKGTAYVGAFLSVLADMITQAEVVDKIAKALVTTFTVLFNVIKTIAAVVVGGLVFGIVKLVTLITKLVNKVVTLVKNSKVIQGIIKNVTWLIDKLRKAISSLFRPIEKVETVTHKMEKNYAEASESMAEFGTIMRDTSAEAQKTMTPFQRLISVITKVKNAFVNAGRFIKSVFLAGFVKLREIVSKILNRIKYLISNSSSVKEFFKGIFDSLIEQCDKAKEKVKELLDATGIDTSGLKNAITGIIDSINKFVGSISAGKIVAIALAAVLMMVVSSAVKTAKAFSDTAYSINSFVKNINKILSNAFSKTTGFVNIAKGIALIAGSIALLTYVDQDNLKRVSAIIAGLTVLVSALAAGLAVLTTKLGDKKFNAGFRLLVKNIYELAAAVALVAVAGVIMSNIKIGTIGEVIGRIVTMLSLMGMLTGMAVALSKWAKSLPKATVTMLALALSMNLLAKAFTRFAEIPYEGINDAWPAFITLFAGMSAMVLAASKIKIKNALGILAFAKVLESMESAINNTIVPLTKRIISGFKQIPVAGVLETLSKNSLVVELIVGLLQLFMFTSTSKSIVKLLTEAKRKSNPLDGIGDLFKGIGGVLAGIGIGVKLVIDSIEKIANLAATNGAGLKAGIATVAGMFVVIGAFFFLMKKLNKSFTIYDVTGEKISSMGTNLKTVSIAVLAMSAGILLIAKAIEVIASSGASPIKIIFAGTVMLAMIWAIGQFAANAGTITKALPIMGALTGLVVAVGVLIGEFAALSLMIGDENQFISLIPAIGVMAGIVFAIIKMVEAASKLENVKTGPIASLTAMIGLLIGGIAALTVVAHFDLFSMAAAVGAMVVIIGTVTVCITKLSGIAGMNFSMGTAVAMIGSIVAIGASLALLSRNNWHQIMWAGLAMVATIGFISAILVALSNLEQVSVNGPAVATSLVIMSTSLIGVALAMKVLQGIEWETLGKAAAILAGMGVALAILGAMAQGPVAAGMMTVSVALVGIAIAMDLAAVAFIMFAKSVDMILDSLNEAVATLERIQELDGETVDRNLYCIADGLAYLSIAGLGGLFGGGLGLVALAGGLAALTLVAPQAAEAITNLANAPMTECAMGIGAIGAVAAVLGTLSPFIIAGAIAIAIFAAALRMIKPDADEASKSLKQVTEDVKETSKSIDEESGKAKKSTIRLTDDIADTLSTGPHASRAHKAARDLGKKLETGIYEGLHLGPLGWGSPPVALLTLMNKDIPAAFQQTSAANTAAQNAGLQNATAYSRGAKSGISSGLSQVGSAISGFWSSVKSAVSNVNWKNTLGHVFGGFGTELIGYGKKKVSEWAGNTFGGANPITAFGDKVEETAKGILENTLNLEDFYDELQDGLPSVDDLTDAMGGASAAIDGVGESAKGASKSVKDFTSDLKSTIEGQLDIFSKFEIKTELTAQTVIDNMKSNIDGFASWSHRMSVLAVRFADAGIDKGLYEKLAEMGPKGYETMNAFYEMSEEQLAEVKDLWATSLTLPENTADIVGSGFQYMGEMAAQGFSHALDDHMLAHAAGHDLSNEALNGVKEVLKIVNGASQATEKIGNQAATGLQSGIYKNSYKPKIDAYTMAITCNDIVKKNFGYDVMHAIGLDADAGLAKGISDGSYMVEESTKNLVKGSTKTAKGKDGYDEHSPSKAWRLIGRMATTGLAIGIEDAANNVIDATEKVVDGSLDTASEFTSLQDLLNNDIDYNPIITPMLDLSYMRQQLSELDSMFKDRQLAVNASGQNEGSSASQQINFTQNNYSPKALSSVDIYRQTKIQLGASKGVVNYA